MISVLCSSMNRQEKKRVALRLFISEGLAAVVVRRLRAYLRTRGFDSCVLRLLAIDIPLRFRGFGEVAENRSRRPFPHRGMCLILLYVFYYD